MNTNELYAVMPPAPLPTLPQIQDVKNLEPPTTRIRTEEDVLMWKRTKGYQTYLLFLRRLSESIVDQYLPMDEPVGINVSKMISMLDQLDAWIDEIPPLPTPQRFGNLAFRTWGQRLETSADDILKQLLPESLHASVHLFKPYLLISFGSFTRMDYGTGHEAAFGILLMCLSLVRFFGPEETAEERQVVLVVFMRYLRLCWKLQDVYRLEPAGSHGVWGLDDSHFLGYIFGSGQLRDQIDIPVNAVLRPNLPPTNLYFLSIARIHQVKHGPFHEHSSQLYSIATGVPNWGKVHSGLFKMYEAEVLGKRVVVQHIPVGGFMEWDKPTEDHKLWEPQMQPSGTSAPWVTMQHHSHQQATYSGTTLPALLNRTPGRILSNSIQPAPVHAIGDLQSPSPVGAGGAQAGAPAASAAQGSDSTRPDHGE